MPRGAGVAKDQVLLEEWMYGHIAIPVAGAISFIGL